MKSIEIRPALQSDADSIWNIIRQVISSGDTYVFAPDSSKDHMLAYWFGKSKRAYVATMSEKVVGTFVLQPNQPDLGSHIANAAYMVDPVHQGKGIGKAMGEYSIPEARKLGYRAMQFNLVIKTNEPAVALWKKLGFATIGEVPRAFQHKELGLVNALIMYREV